MWSGTDMLIDVNLLIYLVSTIVDSKAQIAQAVAKVWASASGDMGCSSTMFHLQAPEISAPAWEPTDLFPIQKRVPFLFSSHF